MSDQKESVLARSKEINQSEVNQIDGYVMAHTGKPTTIEWVVEDDAKATITVHLPLSCLSIFESKLLSSAIQNIAGGSTRLKFQLLR